MCYVTGCVTFVLVHFLQAGTLKVGDVVACGACHGKVRTLNNAAGSAIQSAGPSIAVQLIGLNAVPNAGDEFQVGACL
jgi:translation initiation factor IF-2